MCLLLPMGCLRGAGIASSRVVLSPLLLFPLLLLFRPMLRGRGLFPRPHPPFCVLSLPQTHAPRSGSTSHPPPPDSPHRCCAYGVFCHLLPPEIIGATVAPRVLCWPSPPRSSSPHLRHMSNDRKHFFTPLCGHFSRLAGDL